MMIPIASDHAGFEAKQRVKEIIEKLGHIPVDHGTHDGEKKVDYPDYAAMVARAVSSGDYERGMLICGSGQGMCMTANKFPGIRAALVWDRQSTELSRQHNDANILCLPGRLLDHASYEELVSTWLKTEFEGGRHTQRVNKIKEIINQE